MKLRLYDWLMRNNRRNRAVIWFDWWLWDHSADYRQWWGPRKREVGS